MATAALHGCLRGVGLLPLCRLQLSICHSARTACLITVTRGVISAASATGGNVLAPPTCPAEPGPEDCCQSGCAVCVWDIYREQLQLYTDHMQKHVSETGTV
jgi:Oxidoreductase-like protein, N-terminal